MTISHGSSRSLTIGLMGAAIGCVMATPHSAKAAEGGASSDQWNVVVSPYIWTASLQGDASLAGLNAIVDVPFSDVVEHLDFALMGNVELTKGRFGLYLDGQHVSTSQDEQVLGQTVGLKAKTTSVSAGVFLRLYEVELGGQTVDGGPRRFAIGPTVGVRWTKLNADVQALGQEVEKSVDWTDPFVGVRFTTDLSTRWNLSGEGDLGGSGGSSHSVNLQAYLGYRARLLGRPAMIRGGYRYLSLDYETSDFTGGRFRWDVEQQGPAVGISIRF